MTTNPRSTPVSFAISELVRKHQEGTLEMASGPRCMTSAEQAEVLDTITDLEAELTRLRRALERVANEEMTRLAASEIAHEALGTSVATSPEAE